MPRSTSRKKGCPNCGECRFTRVPSAKIFQFAFDRQCDRCRMRYPIAIPPWAPPLCALLGVIVIVGGGVFCYYGVSDRWPGTVMRSLLVIATGVGIVGWSLRTWRGEPVRYWGRANVSTSLPDPPPLHEQYTPQDTGRSDNQPPVL